MSIERHYAISKLQITQLATSAWNFLGQNSTIVRCCSLICAHQKLVATNFANLLTTSLVQLYFVLWWGWLKSDVISIKGQHYSIRMLQIAQLASSCLAVCFPAFLRLFRSLGAPFGTCLIVNEPNNMWMASQWRLTFVEINLFPFYTRSCKTAGYDDNMIVRLISSGVHDWSAITERLWAGRNLISLATICYIIASTSWSPVGPLRWCELQQIGHDANILSVSTAVKKKWHWKEFLKAEPMQVWILPLTLQSNGIQ